MSRRSACKWLLVMLVLPTTGCTHYVQQAALLSRARSQYYDMSAAGAKAYHCDVQPDWTLFVNTANNRTEDQPLANSPWHDYLNSASLSFVAPLRGQPEVTWKAGVAPPADKLDNSAKIEASFKEMLHGFLTAWGPSLNNTLLPAIPLSDIKPVSGGYMLQEKDLQGRISDVSMDQALRVTHISVHGPNLHAEVDTRYIPSPQGLLLSEMDSVSPQAEGAAKHTLMQTTYADVGAFHVPASFSVNAGETVKVHMRFVNCGVDRK